MFLLLQYFCLDHNSDKRYLINKTKELVDLIYPCFDTELDANNWDLERCHLGLDEWRFEWDNKLM